LDSLLTYEIKYSSSTEWISTGSATGTVKSVNPSDSFSISVRAKDDLGNYSSSTSPINWNYPETVFYINQIEADGFSSSFGYFINDMRVEPVIFQSVISESDFSFDKAVLKIKQEQKNDGANLQLSICPDNGSNKPDFENQLGIAILNGIFGPDETEELTFNFNSPVSIAGNSTYWLVLSVKSYSGLNNFTQWTRNKWQTTVSNSNPYNEGISGKANKQAGSYSDFSFFGGTDWYMKLGLE